MTGTAAEALTGRTATELAAAVRQRRVDPLEVVEAHLQRIASLDPAVHAFQVVRPEGVREEARALASRADLAELPLAGVPVAIKDNLEMAGHATRNGTLASSGEPAASDDELVRRLRRAGAVPIGKTTVPELCLWPFTETPSFGATRNPWSLDHTPGGSSGGSGAAVAAAMAPLALAADGGGSIRIPASCCGLVGIKPGSGIVPAAGGHSTWVGMSEFGPLGTTVADVALMLDVLAGTRTYREVAPPAGALRIAASSASPAVGVKVHPEVERAFQAIAEALRSGGHAVVPANPPYRPTDSLPFLQRAFVGGAEEAEGMRLEALERRTRSWVRTGSWLRRNRPPAPGTAEALRARFLGWFERGSYDLLLTPTLATPPLRVGAYQGKGLWPTILGLTRFMPYPPVANLLGFPAMSVPAGRSSEGLPIGVQLVAPNGAEALLLSVAAQLEKVRPWPRHAPLEAPQRS
jgi:amidase